MTNKKFIRLLLGVIAVLSFLFLSSSDTAVQAQTKPLAQCGQVCFRDIDCVANSICDRTTRVCVNGTRSPRKTTCNPPYPQNACCRVTNPIPRAPTPTSGSVVTKPSGTNSPNVPQTTSGAPKSPTGPVDLSPMIPTGVNGGSTPVVPTGGSTDNPIGDCASAAGPGQKDGKTDLIDYEAMRQELTNQVSTLYCDFNADKVVDVFDFNDFIRIGLVGK